MKTIVLSGFENLNKVKLDKGFKSILGIGLKQGMELTESLLANKKLEITNLTEEQVNQFVAEAEDANADVEVVSSSHLKEICPYSTSMTRTVLRHPAFFQPPSVAAEHTFFLQLKKVAKKSRSPALL